MVEGSEIMPVKVTKYRWVVLFVFCLLAIINFVQVLEYNIVSNVIIKYYKTDSLIVDVLGLVFFIVFIILCVPVSYTIESLSIKTSAIASIVVPLVGCVIKIFADDSSRIYLVMIGQSLCGIGTVYILSMPTKMASTWFGAEEVSTASAIGILCVQLGVAIGAVLPPFVVKKEDSDDEIGVNLRNLNIYYATIAGVCLVIVLLVFRSKPGHPPSLSQVSLLTSEEESFYVSCKKMFKNRDFLVLLLIFGVFNGLWNTFGIVASNVFTHYFPDRETDVGVITLLALLAGCAGCFLFGFILDKTHKFQITSMVVAICCFISHCLSSVSMVMKSRIAVFFTVPLFGLFATTGNILAVEYALEVTYPIPESASCSVMNGMAYFFGIIGTLLVEGTIDWMGYTGALILIGSGYLCCAVALFFVSDKNLKRRQANVEQDQGKVQGEG